MSEKRITVAAPGYSVAKTFDCGQCFRFSPPGGDPDTVCGVAMGRYVTISQSGGALTLTGVGEEEFERVWRRYLALDCDMAAVDEKIIAAIPEGGGREVMKHAVQCGSGIRLLRQEPFETLISFIISQNNNIPRIKKNVAALCERFGKALGCYDGATRYAFPEPEALAGADIEALASLRLGFRSRYIKDAAEKVASGEVSFDRLFALGDYSECEAELMKICGVGKKVAACTLLFSLGKTDAFPVDVWMKRAIDELFGGELDSTAFGDCAGMAQQYIFYYIRNRELRPTSGV